MRLWRGEGWQIVPDVRTYAVICLPVKQKKIILADFMGNLMLNLHSLGPK